MMRLFCSSIVPLMLLLSATAVLAAPAAPSEPPSHEQQQALQQLMASLKTASDSEDWPETLQLAQQVLKLAPDNLDILNISGVALHHLSRYKEASQVFTRYIERAPRRELGYINLGNAYIKLGATDRAVTTYNRLIKTIPSTVSGRTQLATLLINAGDGPGSLRVIEAAQQVHPKEPKVWQLSAQIYRQLKLPENQLRALQTLVILDDTRKNWSALGQLLYQQKHYGRAATAFTKAVGKDPTDYQLWYNTALSHRDSNQPQRALLAFSHAATHLGARLHTLENHPPQPMHSYLLNGISGRPSSFNRIAALVGALSQGLTSYYTIATEQLKLALQQQNTARALWVLIAMERTQSRQRKRLDKLGPADKTRQKITLRIIALEDFVSGVKPIPGLLKPEADQLDRMITMVRNALTFYETLWAQAEVEQARQLFAQHIGSQDAAAAEVLAIVDPDTRLTRAQQLANKAPENSTAQLTLGIALYQNAIVRSDKRRAVAALRGLNKLIKKEPTLASAWLLLGLIHADRKNWRKAAAAFEGLVQQHPHQIEYWYQLATYEASRFNYPRAIHIRQRLLAQDDMPNPSSEHLLGQLLLKTGDKDAAYDIYLKLQQQAPSYADKLFHDIMKYGSQ